jgi:Ca2+-binding EF-hand superfamily protein
LHSRAVVENKEVDLDDAEERLERLRARFVSADISGEGVLDREELRGLLECTETFCPPKHWLPDSVIDAVMAKYDKDNNGVLDFEEFMDLAKDKVLLDGKLEELESAFNAVVAKGESTISQSQLKVLFDGLGAPKSDSELEAIMARYDADGNGQIDFAEFLEMSRTETVDLQSLVEYVAMRSDTPVKAGVAPLKAPASTTPRPEGTPEVTEVASQEDFLAIVEAESPGLVVLEVAFTWCRPCKAFTPKYKKLAKHYPKLRFVKMFGNKNEETKAYVKNVLEVKSSPTFYVFRLTPDNRDATQPLGQWIGAKEDTFTQQLQTYLAEWEVPTAEFKISSGVKLKPKVDVGESSEAF